MKKQARWIIGILAVILILAAVGIILSRTDDSEGEEETTAAETAAEAETLENLEEETVASVTVVNSSGGYTAESDGGSLSIVNLEGLPLDDDAMDSLVTAVTLVRSQDKIADGADRLADFGLEEPDAQVEIAYTDGSSQILLVGDSVPTASTDSRYVLWQDTVYVMYELHVKAFLWGEADFLSLQITPEYDSSSDSFLVTKASVSGTGYEETLTIAYLSSQTLAGYEVSSYQLVSPLEYDAGLSDAEDFLYSIFNLEAEEAVTYNPEEETLYAYGLSEPYAVMEMEYQDNDGELQTVSFSMSEPDEDGYAYVLNAEGNVIYLCQMGDASWVEMDYTDVISKEILTPSIRTLSSLTMKDDDGNVYEFVVEELEDDEDEDYQILWEGEVLDTDNFRSFYYTLISQSVEEVVLSDLPDPSGMEVVMVTTFAYSDGSESDEVIYYQESDRQIYAVIGSGGIGFRLNYTQVEQVLSCLEQLINGEEITVRY